MIGVKKKEEYLTSEEFDEIFHLTGNPGTIIWNKYPDMPMPYGDPKSIDYINTVIGADNFRFLTEEYILENV